MLLLPVLPERTREPEHALTERAKKATMKTRALTFKENLDVIDTPEFSKATNLARGAISSEAPHVFIIVPKPNPNITGPPWHNQDH